MWTSVEYLGAVDLLLAIMLCVSALTDLRWGRIPNRVTYPAMVFGLLAAAAGVSCDLASSSLGLLVGGGSLYVLFAGGWMGGGDVKLMAAVGAIKGFPFILTAMFYSIFMGGMAAALLLIWRGQMLATLGDLTSLVRRAVGLSSAGPPIPARGGTFPFGAAICVGTLIAVALEWWR